MRNGLWIATALVFSAAGTAAADEVVEGEAFAKRWCTGCHVVGPQVRGGKVGPSFEEIANEPDVTREDLDKWMVRPHPPMPNLEIQPEDSANVAAYILSLRK